MERKWSHGGVKVMAGLIWYLARMPLPNSVPHSHAIKLQATLWRVENARVIGRADVIW